MPIQTSITPEFLQAQRSQFSDDQIAREASANDPTFAKMYQMESAQDTPNFTELLNYSAFGDAAGEQLPPQLPSFGDIPEPDVEMDTLEGFPDFSEQELRKAPEKRVPGTFSFEAQESLREEHPILGTLAGPMKQLINVGPSAFDAAKGITQFGIGALNPDHKKNSLANLGRLALGTLINTAELTGIDIPDTASEEIAEAAGRHLVERYGSFEDLQKTLFEDPFGVALDMTPILSGTKPVQAVRMTGKAAKAPAKLLGAGAKKVASGTDEVLGSMTGVGKGAIEQAKRTPRSKAFLEGVKGGMEHNEQKIIEDSVNAFNKVKDVRRTKYLDELEKIKDVSGELDISKTVSSIENAMDDFSVKVKSNGELDFSTSTVASPATQQEITAVYNEIVAWGKEGGQTFDPIGIDTLVKRVDDVFPTTARGQAFAAPIVDSLRKNLKDNVPGYEKMTKEYADLSAVIKDVKTALSIDLEHGRLKRPDTALRKLSQTMRQNFEHRKAIVETLDEIGESSILERVAGTQFNPILPRGLMKIVDSAGILSVRAMGLNLVSLAPFAATSPRLVVQFLRAMGYTKSAAQKLGDYSKKVGANKAFSDLSVGGAAIFNQVVPQDALDFERIFPLPPELTK